MSPRPAALLTLLALAPSACAPHIPPAPPLPDHQVQLDRTTLPDVQLYAIHTATVGIPTQLAVAGGEHTTERGPITAYLVRHPTRGDLLIDAGFGTRTAADVNDLPGNLSTKILKLEMGTPAITQLAAAGLDPSAVHTVILTHGHTDHAGGVEDFPQAALLLDAPEHEFVSKDRLLHGVDTRPFAGRALQSPEWAGPYGPFPKHNDLYSDGSVVLVPTPGHTPGSLSVVVNTPRGTALVLGDAAWVEANWALPAPKGWLVRWIEEDDWRLGTEALWRARAFATLPDVTILPGHEPKNLLLPSFPDELLGGPAAAPHASGATQGSSTAP